jgi:hypothetical protein
MSNSASKTTDTLEHQRIWKQGGTVNVTLNPIKTITKLILFNILENSLYIDVVIQRFRRMISKHDSPINQFHNPKSIKHQQTPSTLSIDKASCTCFNLVIYVPTLQTQISHLLHVLKPLDLKKGPESQIQSELKQTIDQIRSSIAFLFPECISTPN